MKITLTAKTLDYEKLIAFTLGLLYNHINEFNQLSGA